MAERRRPQGSFEKGVQGREAAARGKQIGKPAVPGRNREAIAKKKAMEALLSGDPRKGTTVMEAAESGAGVSRPAAREKGAPEFAETSALSLLEGSEYAELGDVNEYLSKAAEAEGKRLEDISDVEYAGIIGRKDDFAALVAGRLVREGIEEMSAGPMVPDSALDRALRMHPDTVSFQDRMSVLNESNRKLDDERRGIDGQLPVLKKALAALQGIDSDAIRGHRIELTGVTEGLEERSRWLAERQDENRDELARMQMAKEARSEELKAEFKKRLAALAGRLGDTLQSLAKSDAGAIGRSADSALEIDVDSLGVEGKAELGRFLESELETVRLAGSAGEDDPEARFSALNLRALFEKPWLRDFAVRHLAGRRKREDEEGWVRHNAINNEENHPERRQSRERDESAWRELTSSLERAYRDDPESIPDDLLRDYASLERSLLDTNAVGWDADRHERRNLPSIFGVLGKRQAASRERSRRFLAGDDTLRQEVMKIVQRRFQPSVDPGYWEQDSNGSFPERAQVAEIADVLAAWLREMKKEDRTGTVGARGRDFATKVGETMLGIKATDWGEHYGPDERYSWGPGGDRDARELIADERAKVLTAVFELFTARDEVAPLHVYPEVLGRGSRATTTMDKFPYLLGALASDANHNRDLVAAAKWQGSIATKKTGPGWWHKGSDIRDAWIHLKQYGLYE